MTEKIWIVKKYDRDYDDDFNEAAFCTEKEAKEYIDKMKDEIKEIISVWENCRKFNYYPDDDIEYTESEQKFLDMTGYTPWDFLYEVEITSRFDGYGIEEVPLWGNMKKIIQQETLQFVYDVIKSEEERYIELNKNNPDVLNYNDCELLLDNLNNLKNTIRKAYNVKNLPQPEP